MMALTHHVTHTSITLTVEETGAARSPCTVCKVNMMELRAASTLVNQ